LAVALGTWTIYRAPLPVESNWPDVFRCKAAELVAWMCAEAVHALIVSFHDDTDWVAASERSVSPDRAIV
jgi:hypothetical protein